MPNYLCVPPYEDIDGGCRISTTRKPIILPCMGLTTPQPGGIIGNNQWNETKSSNSTESSFTETNQTKTNVFNSSYISYISLSFQTKVESILLAEQHKLKYLLFRFVYQIPGIPSKSGSFSIVQILPSEFQSGQINPPGNSQNPSTDQLIPSKILLDIKNFIATLLPAPLQLFLPDKYKNVLTEGLPGQPEMSRIPKSYIPIPELPGLYWNPIIERVRVTDQTKPPTAEIVEIPLMKISILEIRGYYWILKLALETVAGQKPGASGNTEVTKPPPTSPPKKTKIPLLNYIRLEIPGIKWIPIVEPSNNSTGSNVPRESGIYWIPIVVPSAGLTGQQQPSQIELPGKYAIPLLDQSIKEISGIQWIPIVVPPQNSPDRFGPSGIINPLTPQTPGTYWVPIIVVKPGLTSQPNIPYISFSLKTGVSWMSQSTPKRPGIYWIPITIPTSSGISGVYWIPIIVALIGWDGRPILPAISLPSPNIPAKNQWTPENFGFYRLPFIVPPNVASPSVPTIYWLNILPGGVIDLPSLPKIPEVSHVNKTIPPVPAPGTINPPPSSGRPEIPSPGVTYPPGVTEGPILPNVTSPGKTGVPLINHLIPEIPGIKWLPLVDLLYNSSNVPRKIGIYWIPSGVLAGQEQPSIIDLTQINAIPLVDQSVKKISGIQWIPIVFPGQSGTNGFPSTNNLTPQTPGTYWFPIIVLERGSTSQPNLPYISLSFTSGTARLSDSSPNTPGIYWIPIIAPTSSGIAGIYWIPIIVALRGLDGQLILPDISLPVSPDISGGNQWTPEIPGSYQVPFVVPPSDFSRQIPTVRWLNILPGGVIHLPDLPNLPSAKIPGIPPFNITIPDGPGIPAPPPSPTGPEVPTPPGGVVNPPIPPTISPSEKILVPLLNYSKPEIPGIKWIPLVNSTDQSVPTKMGIYWIPTLVPLGGLTGQQQPSQIHLPGKIAIPLVNQSVKKISGIQWIPLVPTRNSADQFGPNRIINPITPQTPGTYWVPIIVVQSGLTSQPNIPYISLSLTSGVSWMSQSAPNKAGIYWIPIIAPTSSGIAGTYWIPIIVALRGLDGQLILPDISLPVSLDISGGNQWTPEKPGLYRFPFIVPPNFASPSVPTIYWLNILPGGVIDLPSLPKIPEVPHVNITKPPVPAPGTINPPPSSGRPEIPSPGVTYPPGVTEGPILPNVTSPGKTGVPLINHLIPEIPGIKWLPLVDLLYNSSNVPRIGIYWIPSGVLAGQEQPSIIDLTQINAIPLVDQSVKKISGIQWIPIVFPGQSGTNGFPSTNNLTPQTPGTYWFPIIVLEKGATSQPNLPYISLSFTSGTARLSDSSPNTPGIYWIPIIAPTSSGIAGIYWIPIIVALRGLDGQLILPDISLPSLDISGGNQWTPEKPGLYRFPFIVPPNFASPSVPTIYWLNIQPDGVINLPTIPNILPPKIPEVPHFNITIPPITLPLLPNITVPEVPIVPQLNITIPPAPVIPPIKLPKVPDAESLIKDILNGINLGGPRVPQLNITIPPAPVIPPIKLPQGPPPPPKPPKVPDADTLIKEILGGINLGDLTPPRIQVCIVALFVKCAYYVESVFFQLPGIKAPVIPPIKLPQGPPPPPKAPKPPKVPDADTLIKEILGGINLGDLTPPRIQFPGIKVPKITNPKIPNPKVPKISYPKNPKIFRTEDFYTKEFNVNDYLHLLDT
ncbi:collagen alpha-2(IV) chain isoform X5 [Drosophila ficusphila]|uniref:collagen alpha-2(IV) chain isoform X5 n=1 Tax=Drosophila ficusphila TaxID=30025 RepID=UPI001C8A9D6A|nr:collagen alpha-2(IV) chain isoform X5 [Drosophila ficusphila]